LMRMAVGTETLNGFGTRKESQATNLPVFV